MALHSGSAPVVRFDQFTLDLASGELRTPTTAALLPQQPFLLLEALLQRPGEVVTREELRQRLWPADTFVDFEQGLNAAMKRLREALGDSADGPRFIETIPRRGYRFIGPVEDERRQRTGRTRVSAETRRALVVGGAAVVIVLAIGWWGLARRASSPPAIDSLAVLPFANLTGSPEQQHFVDAMHDAVIAELAQIRTLTVISRQSVLRFRDSNAPVPEIARELGVDAVVEGSVFRTGDAVRTTIQIVPGREAEHHLWAGTFHGDLRGILALQGEVARSIASRVDAGVTPDELSRLAQTRPVNPVAYDMWLRGWVERHTDTAAGFHRCIAHASQAVAIDPDYGPGHTLAAECHRRSFWFAQTPPWEAFPLSKAAAQRAIAVDATLGRAHALLGFALAAFDWDWSGAERAFKRSIELTPGTADNHREYSFFLNWMGRHDEAIAHATRAEELGPGPAAFLTAALVFARRYDEAIAHAQLQTQLFPDFGVGHEWLAIAYHLRGKHAESVAAQQQAMRLLGASVGRKPILARGLAGSGQRDAVLEILAEMRQLERTSYVAPAQFAYVYIALGEYEEAITALERGFEVRDAELPFIKSYPVFDPLRDHPRFQALLRRMKFPQ